MLFARQFSFSAAALVLLAGCSHLPPGLDGAALTASPPPSVPVASLPPVGVTARNQIVPLVDAHQHAMSPTAMGVVVLHPSLPSISLPSPLEQLLRAREQVGGSSPLSAAFADDAMILAEEESRWWVGEERILDAIGNFPSELQFVPKAYSIDGSAGFISGNLRRASGEETHNFLLGIRQDKTGQWRIASEMKTKIAPPLYAPAITAERIIEVLDDAGIRYGVVLSLGYWFGQPGREIDNRHAKTQAENDWTVAETAKYPDRLIPFCGVTPTADYAIAELERCASMPSVKGMKVHFGNARVDLENPDQLERIRQFFRAANRRGLAVVVHLRGNADIFINQVLPEAPDVPIQIAHLGSGNATAFADAIEAGKPGTKNLYFDWTQALPIEAEARTPERMARTAAILRRLGLDRILFGSDMPLSINPSPRDWWRKTILTLPLSDEEVRDIADNLPPYMK